MYGEARGVCSSGSSWIGKSPQPNANHSTPGADQNQTEPEVQFAQSEACAPKVCAWKTPPEVEIRTLLAAVSFLDEVSGHISYCQNVFFQNVPACFIKHRR